MIPIFSEPLITLTGIDVISSEFTESTPEELSLYLYEYIPNGYSKS
jgi:hypothetical protein